MSEEAKQKKKKKVYIETSFVSYLTGRATCAHHSALADGGGAVATKLPPQIHASAFANRLPLFTLAGRALTKGGSAHG